MNEHEQITKVAQEYYDSADADAFYFHVWGGEDIHIGLYEGSDDSIFDASQRATERLARVLNPKATDHVLDLGAGYGGAARWMAKEFGCKITCINLSEVQNERNRAMSAEQGFGDRIEVVHGAFEDLPFDERKFDLAFSQDAFLHSGRKAKVLSEAARVLKPGGRLAFADPMQSESVPPGVLEPVLARIHLDHLGSFELYRSLAKEEGFDLLEIDDLSEHLPRHYHRVGEVLSGRRTELEESVVSSAYLDRMLQGLSHWVQAGEAGYLAWGILHFQKLSS